MDIYFAINIKSINIHVQEMDNKLNVIFLLPQFVYLLVNIFVLSPNKQNTIEFSMPPIKCMYVYVYMCLYVYVRVCVVCV